MARFSDLGQAIRAAYHWVIDPGTSNAPPQSDTLPQLDVSNQRRNPPIYVPAIGGHRLRQGEILENLPQSKLTLESLRKLIGWRSDSGEPKPELIVDFAAHPIVIVLTQDCDLEQDDESRKANGKGTLSDILFCDVHDANALKAKHGKSLKEWKIVAENQSPRFQFLASVKSKEDARAKGLPNLAIDFKRYFTMPADEIYERLSLGSTMRICILTTPYVEHLIQRFYSFQSRIALPADHPTDES